MEPVYVALSRELERHGVRHAFGLMSEDIAKLIVHATSHGTFEFHSSRHESVGLMMADGYSWASGSLGVAMLGRGPGLANAITALRTSSRAARRLLVICGDAEGGSDEWADVKASDPRALAAAAGVQCLTPGDPGEVLAFLDRAIAIAETGAPVVLAVPVSLLECAADMPRADAGRRQAASLTLEPAPEVLARIAERLERSRRPLLLAGRGAIAAKSQLEALAEMTGALLGTTLQAKDLFLGHRYDVGIVGGYASDAAREILADIDCVLAIGASLSWYTTDRGRLFRAASIMQIDIDEARIGAHVPVEIGLAADAVTAAGALLETIAVKDGRPLHAPAILGRLGAPLYRGADESTAAAVDPRILVERLDALLPADRSIVLDGGSFMGFPAVYAHVPVAGRFTLTAGFGAIGQGLGAAIGAAVAAPDRNTVLFIGDGGLLMTLGDLETVAREQLPITVVVLNNNAYGSEVFFLEEHGLPSDMALIPAIDFAAIARALGLDAHTIESLDDLHVIEGRLGAGGPILLDCKIRPDIWAPPR